MNTIPSVLFADDALMTKIEECIIIPTIEDLKKDDLYCGFIFLGFIKVDCRPQVIEYNVHMSDPGNRSRYT